MAKGTTVIEQIQHPGKYRRNKAEEDYMAAYYPERSTQLQHPLSRYADDVQPSLDVLAPEGKRLRGLLVVGAAFAIGAITLATIDSQPQLTPFPPAITSSLPPNERPPIAVDPEPGLIDQAPPRG